MDKKGNEVEVKYPRIFVGLIGGDGNAFTILGKVIKALKKANIPAEEVKKYEAEATSNDYNSLLVITMNWVHVCEIGQEEEALAEYDAEHECGPVEAAEESGEVEEEPYIDFDDEELEEEEEVEYDMGVFFNYTG